jgi:hypothetical protein
VCVPAALSAAGQQIEQVKCVDDVRGTSDAGRVASGSSRSLDDPYLQADGMKRCM